jgi:nitrogen fixation NifU-like protein
LDPSLRDLYQDVILSHNKSPRNFRVIEGADHRKEGFNPLCGDRLTLYLKTEGPETPKADGASKGGARRVVDIAFQGNGCAISTGKTVAEADRLFAEFHHLVTRDGPADETALGKLRAFAGVGEFPARVKCATLCWHTLKAALHEDVAPVTTE